MGRDLWNLVESIVWMKLMLPISRQCSTCQLNGRKEMRIREILKEFREEIEKLYRKRLKSIILYGSWARGDATEESDIDVLVVLEGEVIPGKEIDRMIDIITEINLKHGVLISVYPISEKNYSTINSPLLINVRREGMPA